MSRARLKDETASKKQSETDLLNIYGTIGYNRLEFIFFFVFYWDEGLSKLNIKNGYMVSKLSVPDMPSSVRCTNIFGLRLVLYSCFIIMVFSFCVVYKFYNYTIYYVYHF